MAGRVAVAYISRPWGVRGEVRAQALTHRVERFSDLRDVVLQCRAGLTCRSNLSTGAQMPRACCSNSPALTPPNRRVQS